MGTLALGRGRTGTTRRRTGQSHLRSGIRMVAIYALLLAVGVISSIPLYWMVITSLKVAGKEFLFPPVWYPNPQVWSNYVEVWTLIPHIPRYTFQQLLYFDSGNRGHAPELLTRRFRLCPHEFPPART